MEYEKIKETIQKARMSAKTPDFRELVDSFEGFIDVYHKKVVSEEDPQFPALLEASHKRFWLQFQKVAALFEVSPEMIQSYFEDPSNFTPQQWEEVQAVKLAHPPKEAHSSPKKLRKHSKKMRI